MPVKKGKIFNTYTKVENGTQVTVNNSDKIFIVDDCNVEWMSKFNWFATSPKSNHSYLARKDCGVRKLFHIEIMGNKIIDFKKENPDYTKRIIVDHINGDCCDNGVENLRVRTQSENNMNKIIQTNNTTGIVGVYWHVKQKMWNARIVLSEKTVNLGSFYYLRNAVKARVEAEIKYFGEHSMFERDSEYKEKLKVYLDMPYIREPILVKDSHTNTGLTGISKTNNGRYMATVTISKANEINENGRVKQTSKSKVFDDISDAIEWRKNEAICVYGYDKDDIFIHTSEREYMLV